MDRANVELPFGGLADIWYENIEGRTIHPDGTVVPLTGKPFEKMVEKGKGFQVKVKVFTLPDVQIGSIIEYRYKILGYAGSPDWYVQSDLFVRNAYYVWHPSGIGLVGWTPILPSGVTVQTLKGGSELMLEIHDVPPVPKEEQMPPLNGICYRVLFYSTRYRSSAEYWKAVGDEWAKFLDEFMEPDKSIRAAVADLTLPTDSDEQKLRKIYAALMSYENTDFGRALTSQEVKAKGLKDFKSAGDIVARRRGSGDQLTIAFVAMARAVGLKAYVMAVADRSERIFLESYMDFAQIGDYVAIVNLGGVETYFDPGQRYMPFGQLAWFHAVSGGLRETATGSEIAYTAAMPYKLNHVSRVADLSLDEDGVATGKVTLKFEGDPARRWRQKALVGDKASLDTDLRAALEELMPTGMDVSVESIVDIADSDRVLAVTYKVSGKIGSPTGKRLLIPANLFQVNAKPKFPSEKRDVQVDMRYASLTQDAVRYKLPPGMLIESTPAAGVQTIKGIAAFDARSAITGDSITLVRNLVMGRVIFSAKEYPDLRHFYQGIEAHDQDMLLLARSSSGSNAN